MKYINKSWQKFVLIVYAFLLPVISFADTIEDNNCDPTAGRICPPIPITSIPEFIEKILEGALKIGIPLFALALLYCGFLFIKARGNPEEISKAKEAAVWTLVGGTVLIGAGTLAKVIQSSVEALALLSTNRLL